MLPCKSGRRTRRGRAVVLLNKQDNPWQLRLGHRISGTCTSWMYLLVRQVKEAFSSFRVYRMLLAENLHEAGQGNQTVCGPCPDSMGTLGWCTGTVRQRPGVRSVLRRAGEGHHRLGASPPPPHPAAGWRENRGTGPGAGTQVLQLPSPRGQDSPHPGHLSVLPDVGCNRQPYARDLCPLPPTTADWAQGVLRDTGSHQPPKKASAIPGENFRKWAGCRLGACSRAVGSPTQSVATLSLVLKLCSPEPQGPMGASHEEGP